MPAAPTACRECECAATAIPAETSTGAPHIGTVQHVRLPDLVAVFGFKLLTRLRSEQLLFRQAGLLQKTIQSRDGDGRLVLARQSQFAQQGRASTMRIFALEAFNEIGQLGRNRAWLPAVLARFGS